MHLLNRTHNFLIELIWLFLIEEIIPEEEEEEEESASRRLCGNMMLHLMAV